MANPIKTTGGCHCGKVRFEATVDLSQVISCNCSICSKSGGLLTFTPADQFTLIQGEENLQDYQFNKHIIHHLFCRTCGIRSFARGLLPSTGQPMICVNVRCLDGVDLEPLQITHFDGKSL